jgi:hypothetical protein
MGELLRGSQDWRLAMFRTPCARTTKDGTIQISRPVNVGKTHIQHPCNLFHKLSHLYILGNSKYERVTQMFVMLQRLNTSKFAFFIHSLKHSDNYTYHNF